MALRACFIGSIGCVAETSELQRQAFNLAFREAGLDWVWDRSRYRELLGRAGGLDRIARFARERGGTGVDPASIHARKSEIFVNLLAQSPPRLRPGVRELLVLARDQGVACAWVTTTNRRTLQTMFEVVDGLDDSAFAWVGDESMVAAKKPAPDIYRLALDAVAADPAEVVALEDSESGATAAEASEIRCLRWPGEFGDPREDLAGELVESLDPLHELVGASQAGVV